MFRHLNLLATAVLALALPTISAARDEERPMATVIAESVDSSPIRFAADDRHVLLDAADTAVVSTAIVRRYPMVEHEPQGVVLWRRPKIGWVYVSLLSNPAKSSEVCFTGSFDADKFDRSAPLIDRYFGAGASKR